MTDEATEGIRAEVRGILADVLPSGWRGLGALDVADRKPFLAAWRATLVEHRLLVPSWPKRFGGRDASVDDQVAIAEELIRVGLPALPHHNDPYGLNLLGSTLLEWGTDEQRERYLGSTVTGKIRWAQGYSEADAGSDLFALRTRAERITTGWRINGHKMWQTAGLTANWMFALVRTDPMAPRAKGLSFMLIPLDLEGVEVRGIKNVLGEEDFSEIFLTDVEVPEDSVVGGEGNGARVALTLLGFERAIGGFTAALAYEVELRRLVELVQGKNRAGDPVVRERLARCATRVHAIKCLSKEVLMTLQAGRAPGPESSLIKLLSSEYRQQVTTLAMDVLECEIIAPVGVDGVLALGPQPLGLDPMSALAWTRDYLQARPGTVYGGSSQIQRNTIAEQILGLPRESPVPGGAQ